MSKFLVETHYTCTFKIVHELDRLDEKALSDVDNRTDGKVEIINVTINNRKTKKSDGKTAIKKSDLHDVKICGNTKRWQGAFELSKILANPAMVPKEERFVNDLISTFEYSEKERDDRIRIYLALAMGRTKDLRYATILEKTLNDENEEILAAVIYSLGLINSQTSLEQLLLMFEHESARVRHQVVVALGNYDGDQVQIVLKQGLHDPEPNVRWDAAIALAKKKDDSGRRILLDLMDRKYLDSFPNIDAVEQNQAILAAIRSSRDILDDELRKVLLDLMENDLNMKVRQAARNTLK